MPGDVGGPRGRWSAWPLVVVVTTALGFLGMIPFALSAAIGAESAGLTGRPPGFPSPATTKGPLP